MMRAFTFSLFLYSQVSAFGPSATTRQDTTRSTTLPWGVTKSETIKESIVFSTTSADSVFRRSGVYRVERLLLVPLQSSSSADETSSRPVRIIIAGAPASGKGTQCERIKERFGVVHLSTGDMLRAAVAAKTEVGIKAQEYMDSGRLVPDEVIINVVKERLKEKDCQERGWLLDGFPRTQAQAQALADSGVTADCFLFLNVPDEVLVERVVGRRTDPSTGKIYHMTFSPPSDMEVFSRLVQRSDDTEEKVKVRLEQFHANVDAVKDSYADISVTVDGNQAPETVSKAIFDAIESMLAVAS